MKHLMYVPFTGLGLHNGYRGDKWLTNRLRVFNQYVLPSLLTQSNHNFILWISFRPQERSNPIVRAFADRLHNVRDLTTIITYDGVCFWDDKHKNDNLLERLTATLPGLKQIIGDKEDVLMTIQPSDDVYLFDVVGEIQSTFATTDAQVLGYTEGYIMNYATKEIAEYNPDTRPPFFTVRFPASVFFDPKLHYEYTGPYKSHEYIGDKLTYQALKGRKFIVGTHGENISTTFIHPYKGRTLSKEEAEKVMWRSGIFFSDPVVVKRGVRLLARTVLNEMPYQDIIRSYYHKLPQCLKIF